jgi:murein DD-endopeptidase MepM/ murein hydrolase activator NlpD
MEYTDAEPVAQQRFEAASQLIRRELGTMRKTVSLFILGSSGSPIKQITLSKVLLRSSVLCVLGCFVGLGYILIDYSNLKKTVHDTGAIARRMAAQQDEITGQRRQIQRFAEEINTLKTKLVTLNGFEKKIRVIANIEQSETQESLFGVGGSIPHDMDAAIPLASKHNSLVREMHQQAEQLQVATAQQGDSFESLLKYLEKQVNLLASTPAIRPTTGWKTSGFGYRTSPFTGLKELHKGVDIATRKGTPIVATADGVVAFAGSKGMLGKMVALDHGHGMVTRYGHVHKILKKKGASVKRGDKIALVGTTGRSTGPHLHYEIILNGLHVNPEKYILN